MYMIMQLYSSGVKDIHICVEDFTTLPSVGSYQFTYPPIIQTMPAYPRLTTQVLLKTSVFAIVINAELHISAL